MSQEVDPYQMLGVARGASLEEVRLAYRRGVLKYHPDGCDGDPAEAIAKFHELQQAYRTVLQYVMPAPEGGGNYLEAETIRPADFARGQGGWHVVWPAGFEAAHQRRRPDRRLAWKRTVPVVNETGVFVVLWVLAIALALAAAFAAPELGVLGPRDGEIDLLDVLGLEAFAVGVYGAVVGAALVGLLLTRRVIWLSFRLWRRALPAPPEGSVARLPLRKKDKALP